MSSPRTGRSGCRSNLAVEIIAHRGASHDAPENTLAAIKLAWDQNADAVEIDVQSSKNNRIVVIHDETTKRTGGLNRRISGQTLTELRRLDVGKWKGRQWIGERIPTLEEVLETIPKSKRLFVEIKCGAESIPTLKDIIQHSGKGPEQVVLIGFSLPTMKLIKAVSPELEVCWVIQFKRSWKTGRWSPQPEELIARVKESRLNGVDLGVRGPLTADFVSQVHAAGLKVYVWTVDSPVKAQKLAAAGVDGITTNRPGWLRDKLE